jgi:RHS repeat-associated protein
LTYSSITYSDWTRTVLDENGHYKTEYYDAYGRIVKIEEHNNSQTYTTIYEYDTMGNLVKLTDDKDNVTQVWYDSLGRKLKMDDPDMGVWNYEYDKVGNLLKQTDAKSQAIEFVYDALNRLTQKRYNAITQVTYQYDDLSKEYCIGRLAKIIDQSGSSEFFYDNLGREAKSIKTVSASGSYSVERTYDALNRLLTLKYPDGSVIKYEYNPQGIKRISNLSPTTYGIISNIDYSPTGQITKIQYGNGTETKYIYDPQTLRLKNLTTQSPQGKIQDLNYQFDNVGNIKNIADYVNTATQAFLYDDLNRLIQAQGSYGSFTYDYDSIGNMLYKEGVSLSYGKQGRLPHAVTQFGSTLLDYDANGNMIEKGSLELTYDTENRLSRAKDNAITQPHTITISLSPGWNFVSLPVIPQDPKIDSVLSAIAGKYDQVSRYNSSTKQFENYCGNPKYDQFSTFEYGEGYQIYITDSSDITLTLTGIIPDIPEPVSLRAGYNLIFSPKISEATVEAVLSSLKLGVDYAQVFCYNKSLKQFQEYSSAKKEFTTLQPGVAYYLYGLKDMSWTINNTSPTTSFLYDGDGGRVSKTVQLNNSINPITQVTYIGSLFEISEGTVPERGLSRTTTKHIFAGANRICAIESTGNQYFYHSDHLGSSNVITDVSGNQVQLTEFTPYGSTFKNEGSDVTKHKFTGKELDKTTGLYFYGARYYDPSLAHFITPDSIVQAPFDPQSLNRYSYCRNNPLIYTDPTGHSFWGAVGGFFSAIGSFIGGFFSAIGGFFSGFFGGAFGRGGSSGGSGGSSGGRSGGGGLSVLPSSSRQGSGPSSSEVSSSFISGAWNFGASVGNVLGSVFRTATFNLSGVVGDWASENWARATESRKTISPYASNFTGVEEVVAVSALPGLTEFVFGVIAILSVKATPAIGRAFDNLVVHFASGRRSSQKTPSSQQDLDRLNRQRTKSDNPLKPKQVPPDRDPTPAPIDPTNRRAPFSDPDGEYGPPWDDTMWRDALNN